MVYFISSPKDAGKDESADRARTKTQKRNDRARSNRRARGKNIDTRAHNSLVAPAFPVQGRRTAGVMREFRARAWIRFLVMNRRGHYKRRGATTTTTRRDSDHRCVCRRRASFEVPPAPQTRHAEPVLRASLEVPAAPPTRHDGDLRKRGASGERDLGGEPWEGGFGRRTSGVELWAGKFKKGAGERLSG